MPAPAPPTPDAVAQAYAAWRRRTLAAALVATAVAFAAHGPVAEVRVEYGDGAESPSPWLVLGLAAVVAGAFGPGLAGGCLALAALAAWRRLRRSCRLARAAWVVWVLGPLPVLLVPVASAFNLDPADALRTSTHQVRYLLLVTAPAFFALLPGALKAALVLLRFLPESRAPGQITLLAAPACIAAYVLPMGVLAQVAFHTELYVGLLLLSCSPVVPLLAVRRLLRRNTPEQAARLVRAIGLGQTALAVAGAVVLAGWVGEHPVLRTWVGHVSPAWVAGVAAKALASKWLTTVVVTDTLVAVLHREREAARSLAGTPAGDALARRLDALGEALRPAAPHAPVK